MITFRFKALFAAAAALCATSAAEADAIHISFSGPGVSGSLVVTYGPATDLKYSQAYEITKVTGTFTDTNIAADMVNVPVTGLVAVNNATPESTNLLAPNDFSRFGGSITGLPSDNKGYLTYDNLFWPSGAPQTASDYPFSGGFFDIYGLMFEIGGGTVVDLFSWGNNPGAPGPYGLGVANLETALDYVGPVTAIATPEPSTWAMLGLGLAGLAVVGGHARRRIAAPA